MRRISALTGVRRVIIIAAAAIAAMAFLPAIASAAEENPPPNEGNAFVEVFLVEMGWTPAQGWPPAEYASPDTLQPIHWSEVEEKGEVPLEGGHNDPELSVERIASIVGVPLERLSSLAARNHYKEYVLLDRPELVRISAAEAPYVEAEREHGKPTLTFVVPRAAAHPARIAAGVGHSLQLVLVTGSSILELAPLRFSPTEPNAGATVDFAAPGLEGGADPGLTYTYLWHFGDGTTSTDAAPKHVFPAASENGTSNYEVTVEVVARRNDGEEIASAQKATTVPVQTTTGQPPSQETPQLKVKPAHGRKGRGGEGHSGVSAHHGALGAGGLGGTGGKGRGGTAGHGRGIGGRAGESEGNPNQRASSQGAHPSPTHGHEAKPTKTPSPSHAQGRAPKPIEKPAPAPRRPQPSLTGILLASVGNAVPPAMLNGGSTPSPTALPLRGLSQPSQTSVSPLGAIGLIAGILAVVLFVLWGAVSEMRVGWFVR